MTASADHSARRFRLRIASLAAAALCATVTVNAASAQGTPEERRACKPDVMRLCRSEIPNVPRITACLIAKRPQLSEACAKVMSPDRHSNAAHSRSSRPVVTQ
ncbi:MAG: hypothetical protein QM576_03395 [Rhodopseudomonas sp.]|uniref:hypothetical protein n=1 Tax=Rhodopseudomonas sp. TaxID=1078 RepID=UPI0039E3124A